ncbi:MAG: P-loop NTPase fold protein [Gammaproteobacteria bacterium]|nr:P-loop NTPase fold protein [Gammaproteobacteria bacterium]
MSIRIQPAEIEIPKDDLFKNDLLEREEPIKVLTHLLKSVDGNCVLAVDASWGEGKSTFLRLWAQYMRNDNFPVIEINAWESDFSNDPFLMLSTELTEGFKESREGATAVIIDKVNHLTNDMLRYTATTAVRMLTSGIIDIDSFIEKQFSSYKESKDLIKKFKEKLEEMTAVISKGNDGNPLVIMIDELDRCRPSYAVGLLEAAKHLFSVHGIIFVLAINRMQLSHSIKALYGGDFDALGYLQRFVDIDFQLPFPKREKYIENILALTKYPDYFDRTFDKNAKRQFPDIKEFLINIFENTQLSIRQISQALHRFGLVLGSLKSNESAYAYSVVIAIFLRSINTEIYHSFVRGEITDLKVVDEISKSHRIKNLLEIRNGYFLEALLIEGAKEIKEKAETYQETNTISYESSLLGRYQELINSTAATSEKVLKRAEGVIEYVKHFHINPRFHIGFLCSTQRIELLAPELTESENH